MNLALVEPLRELFKDEVRQLGLEPSLPKHMITPRPRFPGTGLAVRCLGTLNRVRGSTTMASSCSSRPRS